MNTNLDNIKSKLDRLHKKESEIQANLRKMLKEPSGMSKVQSRSLNESKLRELREEIEQEEYILQEAQILLSLKIR